MKKFLFFLLILSLIGCNLPQKKDKSSSSFHCPRVFFSSEDNMYIQSEQDTLSIDNLSLKAELNNFAINENCIQSNEIWIIPIDILIVVKPLDNISNSEIDIPIYASLLDENDNILETQYFSISGFINKNKQLMRFVESDINDKITIVTSNFDFKNVVIGFMLDNKKREILN